MKKIFSKPKVQLSIDDINKTIPQDAQDKPNEILRNKQTEWRWRFYIINDNKYIEMSRKDPDKERQYMDISGEWINYEIMEDLEKYITNEKYYYSS